MTNAQILNRIHDLEHQLEALKRDVGIMGASSGGWRQTAGVFANDPLFEKAMKYGKEYRRSTRPKASSRRAKPR